MAVKLYVGNLPYSTADADLTTLFAEYGTVVSASVISDRETGRSKGFGFVEIEEEDKAKAAIEALNGKDFGGRNIVVNEARPREDKPPRREGGFGGDRGGNGGSFRQRSW
jgi:cold-inducible RNA-binding protein